MTEQDEAATRRIVRRRAFWRGFRDGWIKASMIGLPLAAAVLLWWKYAHADPTPTPCTQPGRHHYPCSAPTPDVPMRTSPCPKPEMTVYHQNGKTFAGCATGTLERSGGCSCVPTTDMRKP